MIERRLIEFGRLVSVSERRVIRQSDHGAVWGPWMPRTLAPETWRAWVRNHAASSSLASPERSGRVEVLCDARPGGGAQ
jgi:hypothetical protein